jgi:hypothetical protein
MLMFIGLTHSRRASLIAISLGLAMAASAQASRPAIPFHGTFTGQLSLLAPFSEGSADRCNANSTEAGEFPGFFLTLVDSAVGEFTHLGRTTVESTSCLAEDSPLNVQGEAVFHAANGDQVFLTFDNVTLPTEDPDILDVIGTESIAGGTGRFAGASGTQDCRFSVRLSTGTIEGGCNGEIVFE